MLVQMDCDQEMETFEDRKEKTGMGTSNSKRDSARLGPRPEAGVWERVQQRACRGAEAGKSSTQLPPGKAELHQDLLLLSG